MRTVAEVIGGRAAYWVAASWRVDRVVAYLCEKRIGAVPVIDGEEIVGVFSERDLMKRVVLEGHDTRETSIQDVMTRDVISVSPETGYLDAKALMITNGIRHLLVKDEQGRLKGFLSIRELSEQALREAETLVTKLNDDYYNIPGSTDD